MLELDSYYVLLLNEIKSLLYLKDWTNSLYYSSRDTKKKCAHMLPQHQHSAPFDSQVVDSWHTFPLLNTVLLYDDFLQQQTYIIYLTK